MGLVKFGGGVASISGKVGGSVYAHNRYGSYVRNWKMPVDPGTAAQGASRARLSNAAEQWRTLTAAARTLWEQYAAATPLTNRIGEVIYLSGQAMYARSEAWVSQIPGQTMAAAPETPGQAAQVQLQAGTIGLDVSSLGVTVTGTTWANLGFLSGANDYLQVQVSPPLSAGVTFCKGPWITGMLAVGAIELLVAPGDPLVLTGVALVAGQTRFVRVRQMDEDGRLSPPTVSGPIVVAS